MSLTRRGVAHLLLVTTLGVGFASTNIGSSVAADDPQAFVAAIYQRYENGGDGVPLDREEAVRALFEPRLAQLIIDDSAQAAELGDVSKLDGDPFIDGQDWDISDLRVAVDAATPDRAEGIVTFLNFGEPKQIELQLVQLDEGWRIRDIHWPDRSLRGLYTH